MENICLNCDHLFRVFGTTICDVSNQIVHHPNRQTCGRWERRSNGSKKIDERASVSDD